MSFNLKIVFDREEDGRWIAEIPELPGVLCYGATQDEASRAVQALALRDVADQIEAAQPAKELELRLS
jgi:predicted RNase H-like HicB family nuclease